MTTFDYQADSLTQSLSNFGRNLKFSDLSSEAILRTKNAIIDCIGCMLAGTLTEPGRIASNWAIAEGGGSLSTAIGLGYKTSPSIAAFVNGTTGHALDYDDVSPPMIGHPSVSLVPAIFAASELNLAHGTKILVAYVIGLEIQARIGRLMNPHHYAFGWHATSTLGAVASAASVARIMNLDDIKFRNALGISASGAGGLRKNFGSMTKALHAGQAAQRGISAAMLASSGFDADLNILDGQHGFLDTFRGSSENILDSESIRFDLLQPLEIIESGIGIKQYACCGCSHTAIDVLFDLMSAHGFSHDQIERIDCYVNRLVPGILIHTHASTGFQGKFSMAYSVAIAALDGKAGPKQFDDKRAANFDIQSMQKKVFMSIDSNIPVTHGVFPTRVDIKLKDGSNYIGTSNKARGMHPDLPLSQQQVDDKFRLCAADVIDLDKTENALNHLRNLENISNIKELMNLISGN
jgi:2-methylcitrate dehydratase PrpD